MRDAEKERESGGIKNAEVKYILQIAIETL
jgi:hypothetical protein